MNRDRLRAIWANVKSRTANTGRALNTQYKSNRELSESEYRAKYRTRRGAYLGAGAGAVGFGVANRKNPIVKRAARQALGEIGETINATIVNLDPRQVYIGARNLASNPTIKNVAKKALPVVAAGAAAGGLARAFINPELVIRKQQRTSVNAAARESTRVKRIRRVV